MSADTRTPYAVLAEARRRLGAEIKQARELSGSSIASVAERAGFPRATIRLIEAGHDGISLPTLLYVVDALGMRLTPTFESPKAVCR